MEESDSFGAHTATGVLLSALAASIVGELSGREGLGASKAPRAASHSGIQGMGDAAVFVDASRLHAASRFIRFGVHQVELGPGHSQS